LAVIAEETSQDLAEETNRVLAVIAEVTSQDLAEEINHDSAVIVEETSQDLVEVINHALEMTAEETNQDLVEKAGDHFQEIRTVDHLVLLGLPVEIKVEIQGSLAIEVAVFQRIWVINQSLITIAVVISQDLAEIVINHVLEVIAADDKPRFGSDRPSDKPRFGNDRGGDKPRFGSDRPSDKPRFGNDRGGDKPRFGSDRPSDKPRFGNDRGGDKPRFGGDRDKPRFGNDRGGDKPRFGSDRPSDKAPENRRETFDSAEKFNKPKPTGAVGLSKFRPRGSEPMVDNTSDNRDFNEDKQKTYGIPKAEKADTPKGFKGSKREFNKVASNLEKGAEHAKSDEIRLNRYIANSGICSRREADELIQQGMVRVNGDVVTELGTKIRPSDNVKVEDRKVIPEKPVYIIMNKPKGYITTTDDPEGRKTVMELIDLPGKERIYPIGRLDRNTTGVLLLTNDGEMTQKLMHPSFEIKKVYRATLDKKPSKEHMLQLVQGVELEDGMMAFEQCGFVEEGKENVLGIEIKSGRNRIVRRMFEHFGYDVTALDRVLLGEFDKVKLGRGKWRFLTEKEMNYVDRLKRTKPKAPKN
jgi:23S rRNA pseudouridine2605 synthase